jgi:hypothetical protein
LTMVVKMTLVLPEDIDIALKDHVAVPYDFSKPLLTRNISECNRLVVSAQPNVELHNMNLINLGCPAPVEREPLRRPWDTMRF